MDLFTDPVVQKKCAKAVISYMGYFGSRFVGNDIQLLCGNILDTPLAKSFTLFCIMYQAVDNLSLALVMTLFFISVQYVMSINPACNKYVDKTTAKNVNIGSTVWAVDKDLDSLNLKPKKFVTPNIPNQHQNNIQNNIPNQSLHPMAAPTTSAKKM